MVVHYCRMEAHCWDIVGHYRDAVVHYRNAIGHSRSLMSDSVSYRLALLNGVDPIKAARAKSTGFGEPGVRSSSACDEEPARLGEGRPPHVEEVGPGREGFGVNDERPASRSR